MMMTGVTRVLVMVCLGLVLGAALGAVAQEPVPVPPAPVEPAPPVVPPAPGFDWSAIAWKTLLAGFINAVAVVGLVQWLKAVAPWIRATAPWVLPLFAMLAGPIVTIVQGLLAGWLGLPIDLAPILGPFTPVLGAFTGATAVALHQVARQARGPSPLRAK
jgi:hypothetical protein